MLIRTRITSFQVFEILKHQGTVLAKTSAQLAGVQAGVSGLRRELLSMKAVFSLKFSTVLCTDTTASIGANEGSGVATNQPGGATQSVSSSTIQGSGASAASFAAFWPLIPSRGTDTPVVSLNAQMPYPQLRALLIPPLPEG